jgi:hypothetical protein
MKSDGEMTMLESRNGPTTALMMKNTKTTKITGHDVYKNGTTYDGEQENGLQIGHGVHTEPDGSKYEGIFAAIGRCKWPWSADIGQW